MKCKQNSDCHSAVISGKMLAMRRNLVSYIGRTGKSSTATMQLVKSFSNLTASSSDCSFRAATTSINASLKLRVAPSRYRMQVRSSIQICNQQYVPSFFRPGYFASRYSHRKFSSTALLRQQPLAQSQHTADNADSNTTTTTNNSSYVFNSKLMHDSFYRFMYVERPEELRDLLIQLCNRFELLGSIIVGHEGYNGMLAGKEANLDEFWSTLESSQHNEQYARLFSGLMKKRTVAITEEEAAAATAAGADIGNRIVLGTVFRRLKIKVKPEIVTLRQHVPYADKSHYATPDGTRITGIQVPPAKWRELINRPDVVLIDNRNDFEYKIGTFKGAINPGVNQFSDFAEFVRKHKEEWRGKKVAMFCTGGIRCEKASTWMLLNPEFKVRHPPTTTTADTTTSAAAAAETAATTEESTNATTRTKEEEEEDAIDGIYQLEGGILNYFAAMPDAHLDFEGECFVFDGRRTLDTRLQITRNEEALAKIDKFNLNDARLQKKQQEQQQHQEERE